LGLPPIKATVGVVSSQYNRFTSSQLFLIMSISRILSVCPDIQRPLGELFAETQFREPLPFLEFLNSDINTSAIRLDVSPGGGKLRQVQARWIQRLPESIAVEGADIKNCSASEEYGDSTETYTLETTDTYQVKQLIDAEAIATHCQDNDRYVLESIARLGNALERAVASAAATQAAAQMGKWGTEVSSFFTVTDDALVLPTKLSDGSIAPFTLQQIQQATQMAAYPGAFVGFGGAAMNSYAMQIMAGCCAQYGIDLSAVLAQYGFSFSYDQRLATALGGQTQNLITIPGAIQLLSYNLASWNQGLADSMRGGQGYSRTQVFLPSGLPVDLTMKDDCGNLSIVMTFTGKVVTMPDDVFEASDKYAGVKFVNQVSIVNPS